jgi:putative SOS response-associated peptidase YedK
MCGRYVNVASTSDLTSEFDAVEVDGDDPGPSWNIAPTDPVRVVLQRPPRDAPDGDAVRQLHTVQWGS